MKILSPSYSLKLENFILFLNQDLIFFPNGHICNVVSILLNVVKIDVEKDNVVLTLSNIVQFNVEIYNVVSTHVSTLLNVVNVNVDVHNIVSTLIWCCTTSWRHINLKTTLNRRWNVCWVNCICYVTIGFSSNSKLMETETHCFGSVSI